MMRTIRPTTLSAFIFGRVAVSDTSPRINIVSADARYLAAWSEVNTRIAQRQNAFYIFLTISLVVIAFSFSKDGAEELRTRALVLLAVPLTGLAMALLNDKHDQTISLLRSFLRECEKRGAADEALQLRLISYNLNLDFADPAAEFRRHHNRAFVIAIALISTVAFLTLVSKNSSALFSLDLLSLAVAYVIGYVALTAAAMYVVWKPAQYDEITPSERRQNRSKGTTDR
ncbi:amino acid transporter [Bradyrhizobium japonicum]